MRGKLHAARRRDQKTLGIFAPMGRFQRSAFPLVLKHGNAFFEFGPERLQVRIFESGL